MSVDVRHVGSCFVVSVEGRFDLADATWLADAIDRMCADEASALMVIDLTGVSVVERGVARVFATRFSELDDRVAIVSDRLSARRILRRWGGDRVLLYPSVATAVEQLSARTHAPDGVPALASSAVAAGAAGFRHEAMPYAGVDELVERLASFVADGLTADEPVLVALTATKLDRLRRRLGPDAGAVRYVDIGDVGRNPARIIPVWTAFAREQAERGRRGRGVGEPVWAERTVAELVECQRHESLLNLAFAEGPPWWLLCPYDTASLDPDVIEESHRSHPYLFHHGVHRSSHWYIDDERAAAPFDVQLPDPPAGAATLRFDSRSIGDVAGFVGRVGGEAGLWADEARDLARAIVEVATNSVRHGGGEGCLRMWREDGSVVCEVRDQGHIADPLVGRELRPSDPEGRRGLWLANQLCDLVQVRSSPEGGTIVRVHLHRREHERPSGAGGPARRR